MGQKRTLLNKLSNSTRQPSKKSGTPYRRVITSTVDAGDYEVRYTYHTTKGRVRWIVAKKAAEEAPAVTEEAWPEPITPVEPLKLRPLGDMPLPASRGVSL